MSTSEEIREVYESDIDAKTRLVQRKYGLGPFYENFDAFRVFHLFDYDPPSTREVHQRVSRPKKGVQ